LKTEDKKMKIKAKRKHEVLIIGDSHVRGCAAAVSPNLGENFEVTGRVIGDLSLMWRRKKLQP
jgi:hypothetical protein